MLRPFFGLISLALVTVACGTEAVGVSECRALEQSRCSAAAACGFPDVAACQRYQRDQCLHGVALDSISALALDACVRDIERAGRCAEERGGTTLASACAEPVAASSGAPTACDVVASPEVAASCNFLAPTASLPLAPVVPPAPAPVPAPGADGGA